MISLAGADGASLGAELAVPDGARARRRASVSRRSRSGRCRRRVPTSGWTSSAVDPLSGAVGEGVPLVWRGWSFGGDVSPSALHERVAGWFGVAAPSRLFPSASEYVAGRTDRVASMRVSFLEGLRG